MRRAVMPAAACLCLLLLGPSLAPAQPPQGASPPTAAGAAPGAGGAASSTRGGPPTRPGWQADLGGAVIVNPRFQGSADYRVLPVPYFDVRYNDARGNLFFANVPQGIGAWFLRRRDAGGRRLAASAAVAPGFANRDPDDLEGLDTFGTAIEGRVRIEYGGRRFGVQASIAQALGTGHEGLYADLGASARFRLGERGFASVGPAVRFGDGSYVGALYSVSPAEATRTGLAPFAAEGGLESVAAQAVVSLPLAGRWRWTGVARIGVLQGDARDSTLTESATQAFVLTAFTRRL